MRTQLKRRLGWLKNQLERMEGKLLNSQERNFKNNYEAEIMAINNVIRK